MSTPIGFSYDADGNRTMISYPNGTYQCIVYDASNRISEIAGFAATSTPDCSTPSSWPSTKLTDFTYSYLKAGNDSELRWASTSQYGTGSVASLYDCYDPLNRLASVSNSAGCPTSATSTSSGPYWGQSGAPDAYIYDASGNMTSMTEAGTTRTFSFNNANETTNTGFGYDSAGNQTADPGVFSSASYNTLEQMSSVTPTGGSAVAMAYQGLGQARRVTNGSVSQIEDQLGLEKDADATSTWYTRDTAGTILGERHGSSRYYFLFDANGSVVTTTDSTGAVSDTFHYSPYGTTISTTGSVYEPIRFDGGYDDKASSSEHLIKFGERYYDPTTGRWTSQDPKGNPLNNEGWNPYDYAGDDPINEVDPTGLAWYDTAIDAIGNASSIVGGACTAGAIVSAGFAAPLDVCAGVADTLSLGASAYDVARKPGALSGSRLGASALGVACDLASRRARIARAARWCSYGATTLVKTLGG